MTGNHFNRSRSEQTPADDEHEPDDHRGRVSEPGEDLVLGNGYTEVRDDEGAECDHVVPHTPPQEQRKEGREEDEEEYLVGGHLEQ